MTESHIFIQDILSKRKEKKFKTQLTINFNNLDFIICFLKDLDTIYRITEKLEYEGINKVNFIML